MAKLPHAAPAAYDIARRHKATQRVELSALTQPETIRALAYWREKCAGRPLPAPRDINPAEIHRLLPFSAMVDVVGPPLDFVPRLIGEATIAAHGVNLTGVPVSALDPSAGQFRNDLFAFLAELCEQRSPAAVAGTLHWIDRSYRSFEAIYLPLSSDGERVDRIFTVTGFPPNAGRAPLP